MSDIVTRLRTWVHGRTAAPVGDLLDEAADEIESIRADWPEQLKSLVKERDYWMRTARAFDEHLATLRVAMMEHPTVRFGAAESRETVPQTAGPAPAADGTDWPTSRAGPVAWVVALGGDGLIIDGIFLRKAQADEACAWRNEHTSYGARIIPLYEESHSCPHVVGRTTQYCSLTPFTLTDKEREAIKEAVLGYSENDDDDECASIAATLRSLLERL